MRRNPGKTDVMRPLPASLGLPLSRRRPVAVLLTDQDETSDLERCFRAADWPRGIDTMIPDASTRDALVAWFGIRSFPCVAGVADGMLLGVEHACTDEACARLADHARSCGSPPFEV